MAAKSKKAKPAAKKASKPAAKAPAKKAVPAKAKPAPKAVKPAKAEKPVAVVAPPAPVAKPAKAPKAPKAEKPAPSLMAKKEAPEGKKLRGVPGDAPEGLDEDGLKLFKQWNTLKEQHKNDRAQTYNLAGDFLPKTPIEHKILGWGYVLKKQNNRIEVLFREGIKILVTNYKP